ncbi:hypothetical protein N9W21_03795, partial [Shewanella sp.]|nr:hypothetical protein [Shewanella sp.]
MKKKLILTMLCLSSVASAQSNEHVIKQTYTDHNRTDGYFIKKVQLDDQKVVQKLITKNWYFSEQLEHQSNPSKEINNCQSLSNALNDGYKALNYQEESMIDAMDKMCNVWSIMGQLSQS